MNQQHLPCLEQRASFTLYLKEDGLSPTSLSSYRSLPLYHRKNCVVCQKEFESHRSDKQTCSPRCRHAKCIAKKNETKEPSLTCSIEFNSSIEFSNKEASCGERVDELPSDRGHYSVDTVQEHLANPSLNQESTGIEEMEANWKKELEAAFGKALHLLVFPGEDEYKEKIVDHFLFRIRMLGSLLWESALTLHEKDGCRFSYPMYHNPVASLTDVTSTQFAILPTQKQGERVEQNLNFYIYEYLYFGGLVKLYPYEGIHGLK